MIIVLGLIILLIAVVIGLTGVLNNSGDGHALTNSFAVFGYHVTGSTGTLFLYGAVVGAIGFLGFSMLLAGARRTSRLGRLARHDLMDSRQETADAYRGRAADQREVAAERREAAVVSPDPADRTATGRNPHQARHWRYRIVHQTD